MTNKGFGKLCFSHKLSQDTKVVAEAWVQLQMKKMSLFLKKCNPNYSWKKEDYEVEYPLCSTAMTLE